MKKIISYFIGLFGVLTVYNVDAGVTISQIKNNIPQQLEYKLPSNVNASWTGSPDTSSPDTKKKNKSPKNKINHWSIAGSIQATAKIE